MNVFPRLPTDRPLRILFVCTGNICRSPTAEAIARSLFDAAGLGQSVEFDSAGTHDYHVGKQPDPRTREIAAQQGYDLSTLRARKLEEDDFERFDLLLAMDSGHLAQMRSLCPEPFANRLAMFADFVSGEKGRDVPDPYYGGGQGFSDVLDLCERGVRGLRAALTE